MIGVRVICPAMWHPIQELTLALISKQVFATTLTNGVSMCASVLAYGMLTFNGKVFLIGKIQH